MANAKQNRRQNDSTDRQPAAANRKIEPPRKAAQTERGLTHSPYFNGPLYQRMSEDLHLGGMSSTGARLEALDWRKHIVGLLLSLSDVLPEVYGLKPPASLFGTSERTIAGEDSDERHGCAGCDQTDHEEDRLRQDTAARRICEVNPNCSSFGNIRVSSYAATAS